MHSPTPLLHAFLMPNMNKLTSMMLLLIKPTFHLISNIIFSTSYSNTKNYLMAHWEYILIKRLTLTSNLEQSRCTTMLTLFLMSTNRPLKRNLTTWLSLVSLNHVGPLNGYLRPSISLRRMVTFDKLPTYAHSIKLSFANHILYLSLQTCSIAYLDTNSLQNLTFPCNTTHLETN